MQKTKSKSKPKASKRRAVVSAQQTIPYVAMHPDGICQLPGGLYTKTVEYEDINYAVASTEDQTAIFGGWSSFLNYFDSSLPFQLSFVNRRSRSTHRYKVNIPAQQDAFNSIRGEFVDMLKGQIAKSNNGIERSKYITFGLPAGSVAEARPRLDRVEADVMGNFKRLGGQSRPLAGRLAWAAPPRQSGAFPICVEGYSQNWHGYERLYCPGQLRLPAEPYIPGGPVLGSCVLLADFGVGNVG